jgi:hypothetical protein
MTIAEVGQPRCSAVRCSVAPGENSTSADPTSSTNEGARTHCLSPAPSPLRNQVFRRRPDVACRWKLLECSPLQAVSQRHEDRHHSLFRTPQRGAAPTFTSAEEIIVAREPGNQVIIAVSKREQELHGDLLICWSRLCAFDSEQAVAAIRR